MILFIGFDAYKKVWVYVAWESLYLAINTYQISLILHERADIELQPMEQLLWDKTFSDHLTKRQMRTLLSMAEEKCYEEEGRLLRRFASKSSPQSRSRDNAATGEQTCSSCSLGIVVEGEIKAPAFEQQEIVSSC